MGAAIFDLVATAMWVLDAIWEVAVVLAVLQLAATVWLSSCWGD